MEILHMVSNEIANLNGLDLGTESSVYNYKYRDKEYALKELDYYDKNKWDNKMRTLLSVDSNRDIIPDYFIKPEFFISSDYTIRYWASRYVNGINFNSLLNDKEVSFDVKKGYLKRIGYILKQMDYIRRNSLLSDFYIGDLHENNFIIDRSGRLLVCDVDSIKINGNKSSVSKYLNSFSLFSKAGSKKYKIDNSDNRIGDYIVDKNTDLYCYNIMVMNFLCGKCINDISVDNFYRYLNYLNAIGIDYEMVEMFNKLLSNEDNANPCYYIDSLTDDKLVRARRFNL